MKSAKDTIQEKLSNIVQEIAGEKVEIKLDAPQDISHGDFSSNFALVLSKKLGKNPREIAEEIKTVYEKLNDPSVKTVEIAGPGFLNFFLSENFLVDNVKNILSEKENYGKSDSLKDQKIMLEFADPNPFKEFHIGHLRNITVGESYARLLESQSAEVMRVNYQGDVGMHVAKALWGMKKKLEEEKTTLENLEKEDLKVRAKFLGEAYALGAKVYEEDEDAKQEIRKINVSVYKKDPDLQEMWEKGRAWSLESFETIYKRVGTSYKRYYFESEVADLGRQIVLDNVENGIFEKDENAVIFKGGDHTRVFVTSEDYATYEAKDMALAGIKYKDFSYDKSIIITAHEQAPYFKVVLAAMKKVFPDLAAKTEHDSFGFVDLKDGKMSSRTGNVILGKWLIDETKQKLSDAFPEVSETVTEDLAVGAVKYSMLKVGREADIQFSFEESINLHGNSGPYLQYAFARTQSILEKAGENSAEFEMPQFEKEELKLLRKLIIFSDVVKKAQVEFAPNFICTYLFELAQDFSAFYEKHRIVGIEDKNVMNFRLALTEGVGYVLKNGLYLLGISAPQKI